MTQAKSGTAGDKPFDAIVRSVQGTPDNNGFLVAILRPGQKTEPPLGEDVSITCSLRNWHDVVLPEGRQLIVLENVREYENGWRAKSARPFVLRNMSSEEEHKNE